MSTISSGLGVLRLSYSSATVVHSYWHCWRVGWKNSKAPGRRTSINWNTLRVSEVCYAFLTCSPRMWCHWLHFTDDTVAPMSSHAFTTAWVVCWKYQSLHVEKAWSQMHGWWVSFAEQGNVFKWFKTWQPCVCCLKKSEENNSYPMCTLHGKTSKRPMPKKRSIQVNKQI